MNPRASQLVGVGTPALPVVRVLGAVTSSSACSPASVPHDRNTVSKGLVEPVVVGELASFYNNAGHCSTRISGGIGRLDRRGSHRALPLISSCAGGRLQPARSPVVGDSVRGSARMETNSR